MIMLSETGVIEDYNLVRSTPTCPGTHSRGMAYSSASSDSCVFEKRLRRMRSVTARTRRSARTSPCSWQTRSTSSTTTPTSNSTHSHTSHTAWHSDVAQRGPQRLCVYLYTLPPGLTKGHCCAVLWCPCSYVESGDRRMLVAAKDVTVKTKDGRCRIYSVKVSELWVAKTRRFVGTCTTTSLDPAGLHKWSWDVV